MAAAYDTYDYPSYWEGREYEHASEVHAIKAFLAKIDKIDTTLEIGAGYGRLLPAYAFRSKRVILSDPSSKLLGVARKAFEGQKNIKYIHSQVENLDQKVRTGSVDLVVMVRVMHHLDKPDEVFKVVRRVLKKNGYFILEFANKQHFKAQISEFFKGNFTFPLDIFPKDIRSKRSVEKKTLPFINYHPGLIEHKLGRHGFKIIEKRSVSNIRSEFLKKHLSTDTLLTISKLLQTPLSYISFGPSIFILAQKKN